VVIDVHSHVLPGLDDGAADVAATLDICAALRSEGVEHVVGTPHVRTDLPTPLASIASAAGDARGAIDEAGIPLALSTGGELTLEYAGLLDDDALRSYGYGDGTYLLIETPYGGWPLGSDFAIGSLRSRGFRCVIAHPERNQDVIDDPAVLTQFADVDCLFQITAASLTSHAPARVRATAKKLVSLGFCHIIASDAHGHAARPPAFGAARRAIGDDHLFAWLTSLVPRAVIEGDVAPARPAARRRRWWSR
jgi:protein-tyrosine phosphatase